MPQRGSLNGLTLGKNHQWLYYSKSWGTALSIIFVFWVTLTQLMNRAPRRDIPIFSKHWRKFHIHLAVYLVCSGAPPPSFHPLTLLTMHSRTSFRLELCELSRIPQGRARTLATTFNANLLKWIFPQAQGPPIWVPDLGIYSIQGTVYSNNMSPDHIPGDRLWMQQAIDIPGTQWKGSFNSSLIGSWLLWQPGAKPLRNLSGCLWTSHNLYTLMLAVPKNNVTELHPQRASKPQNLFQHMAKFVSNSNSKHLWLVFVSPVLPNMPEIPSNQKHSKVTCHF